MVMMMMAGEAGVDAVRPVDDPTEGEAEAEDDAHDDPYDTPVTLVTWLQSSDPSRILEFWESASHLGSSGFTTSFTNDVTRSRTIGARTGHFHCHHDQ